MSYKDETLLLLKACRYEFEKEIKDHSYNCGCNKCFLSNRIRIKIKHIEDAYKTKHKDSISRLRGDYLLECEGEGEGIERNGGNL